MARSKLRSPFVTTASYVTAALTLVGCGGRVLTTGAADDAGSDSVVTEDSNGEDVPSVDVKPPAPGCPEDPPRGGACSQEGLSCDYSRCFAPYWQAGEFAYCKGGQWVAGGSSCNPPPPDPPCPTTITVGSSCYHPSWKVCQSYDSCPYNPTNTDSDSFQCIDGRWSLIGPGYEVPCPVYEPKNGSSCACGNHPVTAKCTYGNCYGSPTAYAWCDPNTKAWNVSMSTCNPPPPAWDAGAPAYDAGGAEAW